MTYVEVGEPVPVPWEPRLIMLDEKNQISEILTLDKMGRARPCIRYPLTRSLRRLQTSEFGSVAWSVSHRFRKSALSTSSKNTEPIFHVTSLLIHCCRRTGQLVHYR